MRVLLDTHAFLWFVLDDPTLSAAAKSTIQDPLNDVLISPASFWEVAIKVSLGKYSLTVPYEEFWRRGINDNNFAVLPIELRHTAILVSLPFHHKDPFDRLMVAQAIAEGIPLVSKDAELDVYTIGRIW
jgi:PIN domain nuclease of toxin-antitoxin system